jgi:hypothetical protein
MSFLEELKSIITGLGIPAETGVFKDSPPDEYIVITPLSDTFNIYTDDQPRYETQEARLSLFKKGNYIAVKNNIVKALLAADLTITDRRYVGHEDNTGYYHYAIDVLKLYGVDSEMEE